jgi:hypothetical protein
MPGNRQRKKVQWQETDHQKIPIAGSFEGVYIWTQQRSRMEVSPYDCQSYAKEKL